MIIIPDNTKNIIDEHIKMINACLPDTLDGYYIFGSVSLGAFDNKSDIDFIAIIKRKATEADIQFLQDIHSVMHKKYRRTILDGMYITAEDFTALRHNSEVPCLRFNDGEFIGFEEFERNTIDAYQLLKHGITIMGEEPNDFNYTVDFDILIHKMRDNLNDYWLNWLNDCRKFPSSRYMGLLFSLKSIEWGVLGVSRQYYTFCERDITSKVGAGEYVLQTLPSKWHRIIIEAMRLRRNTSKSCYKSIFRRRKDALDYIDFIIQESNQLFMPN